MALERNQEATDLCFRFGGWEGVMGGGGLGGRYS